MRFDFHALVDGRAPTYIIAEIGVNHGGDVELAKKMIVEAKSAGADAVKFQTFSAKTLVTPQTPKVQYQKSRTAVDETHFQMIQQLELSHAAHRELQKFSQQEGIDFFSTPYDVDSAMFLSGLPVGLYKIASADVVDLLLNEFVAATKIPTILSTGMATLGEIEAALAIYTRHGHQEVILLHCVSNYPCSDTSLNLRVLGTLSQAFGYPVGFSDHSDGSEAAIAAVTLGACVIEKHFTLDKKMHGPDHYASSDPKEFRELVASVRRVEKMLGHPVKRRQREEQQMCEVSRKSIVLCKPVKSGEIISRDKLALRRPGTGMTSAHLHYVLDKKARRDFPENHLLTPGDVE